MKDQIPCDACHKTAHFQHRANSGREVYRCPTGHLQVFQDA